MATIVSLQGVTKRFGRYTALDGVDARSSRRARPWW